ncbi:hypothetical protein CH063_10151 [Colletotrichum higginsianum]|uniref:Uncharacterized protein n=1 Tax=Colletotrichum higginsianum (strain IMI 349063) TaxID=759273 RepID=H1VGC6_COLHI|nr:hypothetical protein CH063_10151 [Colletotrichum higginsianum]
MFYSIFLSPIGSTTVSVHSKLPRASWPCLTSRYLQRNLLQPLRHLHLDVRDLNVFAVDILGNHLKNDLLLVGWDRLLGNRLYELAQLEVLAVLELGRREEAGVQQANTGAEHRNGETLLLKVLQKLLKRDIGHLETVPDLVQLDDAVGALEFHLRASNRLAEAKEGQREVDEAVLVLFQILLAVNNLVQLQDHQTRYERRRRRNGRDDLSGDELGLVAVSLLNLVVGSAQVATGRDEVDVVV